MAAGVPQGPNGSAMLVTCRICRLPFEGSGPEARCERCGAPRSPARNRFRAAAPVLAAALALAGAMAAVAARDKLVRLAPITARAYAAIGLPVNLRGIAFDDLRTSIVEAERGQVLTIEGAVVNLTARKLEIPEMRIAVRDADSREIYVWTTRPPKPELEPRGEASFRLRLASPPAGAHEVMVSFAAGAEKSAGDKL